MKNLGK